jgi:hypothetical protein
MCNYLAFIPWKYNVFGKIPCLKFMEFYYNYILVIKKPNVVGICLVYTILVNIISFHSQVA